MTRPLYENEYTIYREGNILQTVCREWGVTSSPKLPLKNQLDYILMRDNRAVCFAEIKYRLKVYDTYYVSLHKYMAALNYQSVTKLPSYLIVEFPSGMMYLRFDSRIISHIGMSNLMSRNDKDDNELVAHIEMKHFVDIKNCPFRR